MEVLHREPGVYAGAAAAYATDGSPDSRIPISTGTTIVAVKFAGGLILAADTRTSAGAFIVNRASRKISRIHDRIFACRSGSAADTQALTKITKRTMFEIAQEQGIGANPPVKIAASIFRLMCYRYKASLMAGLICAGWDPHNGYQIYAIPLGGTLMSVDYTAGGSGSGYVAAFMDDHYKPNMSKEDCINFVKKTVAHAIHRDGSSGGMIRLIVLSDSGVEEECVENGLSMLPEF